VLCQGPIKISSTRHIIHLKVPTQFFTLGYEFVGMDNYVCALPSFSIGLVDL
jgi:hypothetical protein